MTTYELLCSTVRALLKGQEFSDDEKRGIADALFSGIDTSETVRRFHARVRASDETRSRYPLFFILPYSGRKKPRLITGYLPRTHVLSANHYELEILRLLALWASDNGEVVEMVGRTLDRLDGTCFGHFCADGECTGASIAALRFLSAVKPVNDPWVEELLRPLGDLFAGIKGQASMRKNLPTFYFCLALSEIQSDTAMQIVREHKDHLLKLLRKGWLTGPAALDRYSIVRKHAVRNALAGLPECAHLRNAEVYVSDKDGRCYCDVYN